MEQPTKRQHQVLRILYQYIQTEGYPPSFEDLRKLLEVASNQTITDLFSALERKGMIRRGEGSARGIVITPLGFRSLGTQTLLPVAGSSRGGPFTETIEGVREWRTVGKEVSRLAPKRDVYLIKVHGDSMEGVIWDGDMVLVMPVHHTGEIHNHDIILVEHDGETTVKRYVAKGGRRYLEPENPKYQPISIRPGMKIIGKIIARI